MFDLKNKLDFLLFKVNSISKKKVLKNLSIFNTLILLVQILVIGGLSFVVQPLANDYSVKADSLCQVDVDVVMAMDRSGSMGYSSKCEWWEFRCVDRPQCTSYEWQFNVNYDVDEAWCSVRDQSAPHGSVWTEYNPTKIESAKEAASSFLNSMGSYDQSALVSFSTDVTLDKALSDDHAETQQAIEDIDVSGATNIGDAIGFSLDELSSSRSNPQAVKAIILLTDGKANKPNGSGYGEDQADVNYAISKASQAAVSGIKIFTIGLGSGDEINESMLLQIADITGATYYHAPNGNDLSSIYTQIAWKVCEYGSISGCKYNDLNNNGQIDSGEPTVSGWDIQLTNGEINLTQTLIDGCYTFAGLEDDTYVVSEVVTNGWVQTYPLNGTYSVTISGHNDVTGQDFANYLPACGNGMMDDGEACELGDYQSCITSQGYAGSKVCNSTCTGWLECLSHDSCGDGIKNENEECDGTDGVMEHYTCSQDCTLVYVPWCGDLIINNNEECDGDSPRVCEIDGYAGTQSCEQCAWSACFATESCGDGIVNGNEVCEPGDTQSCQTGSGYYGYESCRSDCMGFEDQCITTESCGDGVVNGSEQCDDNGQNGIVCEPFYGGDCSYCSNSCELITVTGPYCGDQTVNGDEVCELGDTRACQTGEGYNGYESCQGDCAGWGECIATESCGDGVVNGSEQCDDNGQNGQVCETFYGQSCDYCSNACELMTVTGPYCGDGIKNGEEQCDGSDGVGENQSCTQSCTLADGPYCGDGNIDQGEVCDDGANNGSYGYCSSDCLSLNQGSLTVCKYNDIDENGQYDSLVDSPLRWNFTLTYPNQGNLYTGSNAETGCVLINDLPYGTYIVDEEEVCGWTQTYPADSGNIEAVINVETQAPVVYFLNYDGGCTTPSSSYELTKTLLTEGDIYAGDTVVFELMVENTGDYDIISMDLEDSYDETVLNFVSASPAPTDSSTPGLLVWSDLFSDDSLDPGGTWTTEVTYSVDSAVVAGSSSNSVSAVGVVDENEDPVPSQGSEAEVIISATGGNEPSGGGGGGGGGGSSFSSNPKIDLDFNYVFEKLVNGQYLESITLKNAGNVILTNGILSIDLPELILEFFSGSPVWDSLDDTNQTALWLIPALAVGEQKTIEFNVSPIAVGNPETLVEVDFDQADADTTFTEKVVMGEITSPAENTAPASSPTETGTGGGTGAAGDGTATGGGTVSGAEEATAVAPTVEEPVETEPEPEAGASSTVEKSEPAGVVRGDTTCSPCAWWSWLLVFILHLVALVIFYFSIKSLSNNSNKDDLKSNNSLKSDQTGAVKAGWVWTLPVLIIYALIFLVLWHWCQFSWWLLLLVLVCFYFALACYYATISSQNRLFKKVLTLIFITIPPIVIYLVCPYWSWLAWVVVLLFYILSLIYVHLSSNIFSKNKSNLWLVAILMMTILTMALEWIMHWCDCAV